MLDQTSIPGSDDWWLVRLCNRLGAGLPRMARLTSYRDGDALLPENEWDAGTRASYRRFLKRSRLHVVETVRDARTNRQRVVGFRTGAPGDDSGDVEAWKNWRRSRMQTQSRQLFNDTADFGESFILTLRGDKGGIFQVRNGWNTTAEQNTLRPWLTDAGLAVGYDSVLGAEIAMMFRPGYYRMAYRRTSIPTLPQDGTPWVGTADWTWAGDAIPTPYTQDSLLARNATTSGFGVYEKHLDTVDRINEITLNALSLIVMQAYRQRGVKGNLPEFYPEPHPRAGEQIDYDELFKAGPAALWMLPTGTDIWESQATDVRPVYEARKRELQDFSSLTSTPQDLFSGESNNQSAMGAEISREPLTFAVEAMNEEAEVAIAQSQSQSFAMVGDLLRADTDLLEVMWKKVSPATLAERSEAAPKFKAGGATQRFIDQEVFEMTPAQLRAAEDDRASELLMAAVNAGIAAAGPAATATAAATGAPSGGRQN